jgi:hypothetical protein
MAYYDLPGLRCRFANQGYAAYNGHTTESIIGLTVQEAIGDKAWEAIQPHVERSSRREHVKYTREQTLPNGMCRRHMGRAGDMALYGSGPRFTDAHQSGSTACPAVRKLP